ncbi:MotA/TolQ/ExbB proton channel family protein [Selenomonas sputigena]|uniref:MotA/TolQ/ExbB proton channel n=1 Tax=Selenomonas sputigena (strain ATCC 35185 / DSM 20758 / CCUG 44933 / VPI D19B-28) TaxID=546271 RepID=C9LSL3_SELS3|nr:MotA/TolQ/ExbB proton channel family protein [Selenomonas sputigena]AEC00677.1 MotA/TolQ/ExbB proton channel [Selenomonas sputigena ATCC 35185]EEX78253.1 transporter, MotA/TolQ/ExbB proton channel family protein [Selenomonas sputigena ATCC 35185]
MENFIHLFNSGGFVMYPLLILSLITLAIAVERFYYFRNNRKGSKTFFHGVYHAAASKDWDVVRQLCSEFPSALSRVIEQGMAHDKSEAAMKSAFEDRMSMESISFHRYLDYLSAIVTIAPLLGLLGTVTGMIQTFSVLDNGGGAAAITGGVGEALVATASGLCVAIIAFCFYTYFDHQLDTLVTDTERLCSTVIGAKKESWDEA